MSTASPRFLVIHSQEERSISSLSPFVIEKVLIGMAGEPKSIKKLRSGDLLVEYTNKKQIENLLRLKSFHNLKVQVSLHASLNTCKGVVRCPDLRGVSEEEILEEMREQGVIHVRRIKVRRDDALKDTNTFVFTFNTSVLPKGGGRVVRWCWRNFQCRGVLQFGYCRARAYCAFSRCGWGLFGYFYSRLSFLSSFSLSLGDGSI